MQKKKYDYARLAAHRDWSIERLVEYARNPRKNDSAVDRMCASIREFGFKIPILARSDGEVVDGHLRLKAARKLGIAEVPVMLCDEWTPAQVKTFRLMANRSVTWANPGEIDKLLVLEDEEKANATPPLPENAVSRTVGARRIVCGDATNTEVVAQLLGDRKPRLMVTDPPYGIELDSEWRDRAGLNGHGTAEPSYMKKRTKGHEETSISGDTRADWSEAFALVPSLEAAYVWHASKFTREVLDGLLKIGLVHHQQIIWNKGRTVLTRTLYWFQHEPCWFVRKKNAPWFGKAGENSTIWDSPSPKFIMGSSNEAKWDHPTQKPVELMRRPILNHLRRGELVYEPFLGSGTTLAAAELTGRVCYGIELDPQYVDVVIQRWEQLANRQRSKTDGLLRPLRKSAPRSRHESSAAARRSRTSQRRSSRVIRICSGCALRLRTGGRNCESCALPKGSRMLKLLRRLETLENALRPKRRFPPYAIRVFLLTGTEREQDSWFSRTTRN
jgi:DNA modification methylase